MTPILDIQQRFRELGRIRMGAKVPTSGGKTRPDKLEAWRLTSSNRKLLDQAASLWGGVVQEWKGAPDEGTWWELFTETDSLPIIIDPGREPVSQWMEQWTAGGCTHRCDTRMNTAGLEPVPCSCDPANPACKPTTRISVVLPDIPGLGVWRLDTKGWNAASELPGTLNLIMAAADAGLFLNGNLRLEQRSSKKDGRTNRFAVPVIDLDVTVRELTSGQQPARGLAAGGPVELPGRMELEAPRPVVMDDPAPVDVDVAYAQLVMRAGGDERRLRAELRRAGIAERASLADKQTLIRAGEVADGLRPVSTDPDDHVVIEHDEDQEALDV